MTDAEVLEFLIKKCGTQAEAARELKVTDQQFYIWKAKRGISAAQRPRVWILANQKGARLPQHWLAPERATKRKRAA